MSERPKPEDLTAPWVTVDCDCPDPKLCERCDGYGWFYTIPETSVALSELMRDALKRHG